MMEERLANETQFMVTDDHLSALDVKDDTVLLVRVPMEMSKEEGKYTLDLIRQVVHEKTGHDPGILMVARDCDLAQLDIETLDKLKAEIDATLQYHYSKIGGDGGS